MPYQKRVFKKRTLTLQTGGHTDGFTFFVREFFLLLLLHLFNPVNR